MVIENIYYKKSIILIQQTIVQKFVTYSVAMH